MWEQSGLAQALVAARSQGTRPPSPPPFLPDWLRPEDSRPTALLYDAPRAQLVTVAHRPATWAHRAPPAEQLHKGVLVAALFSAPFRVVVSGDEGGTVCLWDASTGRREGGFSMLAGGSPSSGSSSGASSGASSPSAGLPAAPPKLTALALDASQRRLLAGNEAGDVRCWNPASGAVLRTYAHAEGPTEVTALAFVPAVEEGEAASNDGSASGSDGGGALVLATGWCRALCLWRDSSGERVEPSARLAGHAADVLSLTCLAGGGGLGPLAASGDYEGEVRIWHLPSAACLATLPCGGRQYERAIRALAWLPASCASGGHPLLLAACEDRRVRVWEVCVEARGAGAAGHPLAAARPLCQLPGTRRQQDCITALRAAPGLGLLALGDSGGSVQLVDVSAIDSNPSTSPDACAASFRPRAHWCVVPGSPVASLELAEGLLPGQPLLLVGTRDARVSLWSLGGALVGQFGRDRWDVGDAASWHDAGGRAAARPPPEDGQDSLGEGGLGELLASTPRRASWNPAPLASTDRTRSGTPRSARGRSCAAAAGGQESALAGSGADDAAGAAADGPGRPSLPFVAEEGSLASSPALGPEAAGSLSPCSAGRQLAAMLRACRAAREGADPALHGRTHTLLPLAQLEPAHERHSRVASQI